MALSEVMQGYSLQCSLTTALKTGLMGEEREREREKRGRKEGERDRQREMGPFFRGGLI